MLKVADNFYVDAATASRYLGVTRPTMRKYLDDGLIKAKKIKGTYNGSWQVDWDSLVKFKQARDEGV